MHYLVAGVSPGDMSRMVSARVFHDETSFTTVDVQAAILDAARLVEQWELSAVAASAFREIFDDPQALGDTQATRILAAEDLRRSAAQSDVGRDWPPQTRRAARYAIAVIAERHHRTTWRSAPREEDLLRRTLTSVDDRELEDLFLQRGSGWTPGQLLDRWNRYVTWLEAGGGRDSSEYTNGLSNRDLLEDAVMLVDPSGSAAARRTLDSIDNRFHAVTERLTSYSLDVPHPQGPLRWWWRRAPMHAEPYRTDHPCKTVD